MNPSDCRPHHDKGQRWSETDSTRFADLGNVFVPARDEQIDTICALIPADPGRVFAAVELGAGVGMLARAVLERFPNCSYLALDGSEVMRRRLGDTLEAFGDRVAIRHFALEAGEWRAALPAPLRCILASLVVHHLPAAEKRQLFADMRARLEPGGALILADIVEPETPRVAWLFAQQWDAIVRGQSLATHGDLHAFDLFTRERWNYFADAEPDAYDQPSPLADQLRWLKEAGFADVDCFWMRAGHAIFGGYA